MTSKATEVTSTQEVLETITYDYNLQNRLKKVTSFDGSTSTWAQYTYNDAGIRVKAEHSDTTVGIFLIDAYNHTGYAQVFVEDDGTNTTSYVIGDDVLAQATDSADPQCLLYDGHGSTRQLADSTGSLITNESYSYDAYGVLLGGPRATQTDLLYAGEMYDSGAEMYYLRARYYNPLNGRFNRMDPFGGSNRDPQSLHKYLYAHSNPTNNVDPTGQLAMMAISTVVLTWVVRLAIVALVGLMVYKSTNIFRKVKKVKIYLSTEGSHFTTGVLSIANDIENHLGTIVETDVFYASLLERYGGYDSSTMTYRISVRTNNKMKVLGHANNYRVAINTEKFTDEINFAGFSDLEIAFVAANVLLHEVVTSIYDHGRFIRTGVKHEPTGLMKKDPDMHEASKGLFQFSETTERRLKTALGQRF